MALRSLFWSLNQRLQRAAVNNRPMHAFDPDSAAVRLLQQALAQNLHSEKRTRREAPET